MDESTPEPDPLDDLAEILRDIYADEKTREEHINQRALRGFQKKLAKDRDKERLKQLENQLAKQNSPPNLLITWNDKEGYFYKGFKIKVSNLNTIYFDVFDILYKESDNDGFLSYEAIEASLIKRERKPYPDTKKRDKRIRNAISWSQGFFHLAKTEKGPIPKKIPHSSQRLVVAIKSKGLKLNNVPFTRI